MAATKSAGRVSIRVLPDSTRFKQDLEKSLRRIENQLKAKIEAELYLSRESLAKLKREIENLVVKIKPSIELNVRPEDIEALKAKIEKMKPKVDVLLGTAEASRRIAVLSRDRSLNLWVNVKNLGAMKDFTRHIQGLSGLNVLRSTLNEGLEFFRNIDTNAVKLSRLYSKVAAIAAVATSGVGSIALMTTDIAAVGNLALLAPAFLTGLGISAGILFAALKDMKFMLKDLGPVFKDLQVSLSDAFWAKAEQPIRNMVDTIMPILKPNIVASAGALGGFFGTWADAFRRILTQGKLDTMFGRMNTSIGILSKALYPLTNAFTNLGLHGSKYFARFSNWIVKVSTQFDNFITKSAKNGDLDRWTENAIQGMKDLFGVAKGVWRIVGAISDAARKAKLPDLGNAADGLNRAADVMASPRFQKTLATLFAGAKSAVDGIVDGIKKLGPAIETAAPSIQRVFETVGSIGSRIGGMLAGVISNPTFLKGFEQFFKSIDTSLKNLEPATRPFAESLGGALRLMGKVLESVTKVAAAFAIDLGPVLDKIGNQFETLVEPLQNSLLGLIRALKPVLETFNSAVVTPFIKLIKEQLLPLFDNLVKTVAPSVEEVLKALGQFVGGELTQFFKILNGEFKDTDKNAKTLHDSIKKILDLPKAGDPKSYMKGFNGGWLTPDGIKNGNFVKDWENFWRPVENWSKSTAQPAIKKFFEDFQKNVDSWIKTDFTPWCKKTGESIATLFKAGMGGIAENLGIKGLIDLPGKIKKWWDGLMGMFKDGYEGFKKDFQKWLDDLLPFDDMFNSLFGGGKSKAGTGGTGMGGKSVSAKLGPNFFDKEAELTWFSTLFTDIGTKIQEAGPTLTAALDFIKPGFTQSWDTFWTGLQTQPSLTIPNVTTTLGANLALMGSNISSWVIENGPKWAGFFQFAKDKATTELSTAATSVNTNLATMGVSIGGFIAERSPAWATAFSTMKTNVTDAMNNNSLTTTQKLAVMGGSVAAFLGKVQSTWGPGWETTKKIVSAAWTIITGDTTRGVDASATEAGKLPSKASSAMGDTSGTLTGSGSALVQGFANGMSSPDVLSQVRSAASAVVELARLYFPFSPAKLGPFSGRGYTTHSGRALVKDFAGGMMDNMDKVRAATKAVTGAVKLGANMDLNTDLGDNGITVDRREVTVQVYHPVAEPTSRTIEKASNTLRMAGAL